MGDSLDKNVPRITDEKVLEERYGILLRHVEQIKMYDKSLIG